jgi:hypothetical protein
MSTHKDFPKQFGDTEKRHETVVDSSRDGLGAEPLTTRLADSWSDLIPASDERRNPDAPRSSSAVPLLDEMKGILQWD